jgi:hypothetical protein
MDPLSDSQTLVFAVAGPVEGDVSDARVVWTRAGEERALTLTDDGSDPADAPWDGVWTATDNGPFVRDVACQIVFTDLEGVDHVVFSGVVHPIDARHSVLAWQVVDTDEGWRAVEVAAAWPGATLVIPEATHVYVGAAWTVTLLAAVAGLVHVIRREGVGW